jgi:hypothetical protein
MRIHSNDTLEVRVPLVNNKRAGIKWTGFKVVGYVIDGIISECTFYNGDPRIGLLTRRMST